MKISSKQLIKMKMFLYIFFSWYKHKKMFYIVYILIIFNNISKGLTTLLIKYDEKKYPSYSKLKKKKISDYIC